MNSIKRTMVRQTFLSAAEDQHSGSASRNVCPAASRRTIPASVAATLVIAWCFAATNGFSAEPTSPRSSAPGASTSPTRPPADWGTSRKLQWQPSRKSSSENRPAVRPVRHDEDVFDDGPALQGRTDLAAPASLTQNQPKSPFDEPEPPKSTTPPPLPMPEPLPQPTLPMDTTPMPTPTPMPAPTDVPPPEFNPPTATPTPAPPPTEPQPDEPRTPATKPPGIFLEPPSSRFDSDFPRRSVPQTNPAEDCEVAYNRMKKNTIDRLSIDIHVSGQPGDDVPFECTLSDQPFDPRCWKLTTYTWKASALCHKPIYFEEEALERYGHSHGPGCEYLVSFAHFFGNVVLLPYHMGVETPCECIYTLGVYRPGNCVPYMIDPFPISLRGAAFGAVGYCGTVALFP